MALLALALLATALLLRAATAPSLAGAAKIELSTAERSALDIVKVRSMYDGAGLRVSVRFRGNVYDRLGKGHLTGAAVGLVLIPKTGAVQDAVALSGPGGNLVLNGKGDGRHVALIGRGPLLRFLLPDVDPGALQGVAVKSLVRAPKGAKGLSLAVSCAGAPKGARAAQNADDDAYDAGGTSGKGRCGGDTGSVGTGSYVLPPTPPCARLASEIDGIEYDIRSLEAANNRLGTIRRRDRQVRRDNEEELARLRARLQAKEAELKALQDSGACGFTVGGSAGYDHTYDPLNQGYSSVCVDAVTNPATADAAWTAVFDGGADSATKDGTTGADGHVRAVFRITSGGKPAKITVTVTKGDQSASQVFEFTIPPPPGDPPKSLDCRALAGG